MNKASESTSVVRMEIIDDILYATYLPDKVITIDDAKELIKKRIEYTQSVSYASLVTYEGVKGVDKEARTYFVNEGAEGIIAAALLVNSIYTELFGNFFLRITKPKIPTRLFTDKEEALKWLQQFKPKS